LSDQDTQYLIRTTLVRFWEGIKAGELRAPREDFSYWIVTCTKSAAIDLIRRWHDDRKTRGSEQSFTSWCLHQVPAPEVRLDVAIDEGPSEDLMKALATNLIAFVRERHEDAAQMARDCVLTCLQRSRVSSRVALIEDLISQANTFVAEKFGAEASQAARAECEAASWQAFLLIGILGLGALELAPWLERKPVDLQKSVGRVRRALGY
jgi:DNA-directed RNA polymerase specialized sigma24 family protein